MQSAPTTLYIHLRLTHLYAGSMQSTSKRDYLPGSPTVLTPAWKQTIYVCQVRSTNTRTMTVNYKAYLEGVGKWFWLPPEDYTCTGSFTPGSNLGRPL